MEPSNESLELEDAVMFGVIAEAGAHDIRIEGKNIMFAELSKGLPDFAEEREKNLYNRIVMSSRDNQREVI